MPPKKGSKRKATRASNGDGSLNGDAQLSPPDRTTWPGWVEMESEPAFFNVMLKEMGARGVKIHELWSLDEEMLAVLPQPVHALIFLFRYRDTEQTQQETKCPDEVWFANQIPDFACATVALLNIVNNIQNLEMGKELRDFKDFTKDMDPMARGDAIDGFDFVKHIHNSFARETDLLNADMHMRNKVNRANKRRAAARGRANRELKKAANAPAKPKAATNVSTPARVSDRAQKKTEKSVAAAYSKNRDSEASSPLSDPPDSDPEFTTPSKSKASSLPPPEEGTRRSKRQPKPRKDISTANATEATPPEDGFHFIAYIPIAGRVWKLDGLDSFPHLIGECDSSTGDDWMNIVQPELQTRMAMYEGGGIQFNLMAVVHDPAATARGELAENVRGLQMIDDMLDGFSQTWKGIDGADPCPNDLVLGPCPLLDLADSDIATVPPPAALEEEISSLQEAYVEKLVSLRQKRIKAQAPLRAAVRDNLESSKADEEKADLRRHDFSTFVKGWLGGLAENQTLRALTEADE